MAIADFVAAAPLFSTHEHHRSYRQFEAWRNRFDYRSLLGYAKMSLSVALGQDCGSLFDKPHPLQVSRKAPPVRNRGHIFDSPEEDRLLRKLWPRIAATGNGYAADLGTQALFGIPCRAENFDRLTEAVQVFIKDKTAAQFYRELMHDRCNIRGVVQIGDPTDPALAHDYPDDYVFAAGVSLCQMPDDSMRSKAEADTGIEIRGLADAVKAMHVQLDRQFASGKCAAIKNAMGHVRDITVTDPDEGAARKAFALLKKAEKKKWNSPALQNAQRMVNDYLINRLCERLSDENVPLQMHTGVAFGGVDYGHPFKLAPLAERFPRLRLDVFHMSWPWCEELVYLAWKYPNVYPDFTGGWNLNPASGVHLLDLLLDTIPYNKILGFGGDIGWPLEDVGYALQARQLIARVLQQKIERGVYSERTAEEVAQAVMHDNAESFFKIAGHSPP